MLYHNNYTFVLAQVLPRNDCMRPAKIQIETFISVVAESWARLLCDFMIVIIIICTYVIRRTLYKFIRRFVYVCTLVGCATELPMANCKRIAYTATRINLTVDCFYTC